MPFDFNDAPVANTVGATGGSPEFGPLPPAPSKGGGGGMHLPLGPLSDLIGGGGAEAGGAAGLAELAPLALA